MGLLSLGHKGAVSDLNTPSISGRYLGQSMVDNHGANVLFLSSLKVVPEVPG